MSNNGNLILEQRADQGLFHRYFRMSVSQFDEILSIIGPSIQLENTRWRSSIDPGQQLAICLRFIYFSIYILQTRPRSPLKHIIFHLTESQQEPSHAY